MSVIIKDMDMPADCLGCRIACDKENYGVIGRPPKCPLEELVHCDECIYFEDDFNYCNYLRTGVGEMDFFCEHGERGHND